eukprot:1632931-Alexandrium_andersonii.AAC.1
MCIRDSAKADPLDELLARDPEARVPAVQQRGSVCRRPEVARACRAARQRRIGGEPRSRGR